MKDEKHLVLCIFHGGPAKIQNKYKSTRKIFGDSFNERIKSEKLVYYYIEECDTCKAPLVFYSEKNYRTKINLTEAKLVFPEFYLHECVPELVAKFYKKALSNMNNDRDAFTHQVRKGLEAICIDRGAKSSLNTLAARIKKLVDRENLPSLIWEMMDQLKDIGNFGSHVEIKATLEETHVPAVHMFFRALIEYVYIVPFQIEEFRQEIEKIKSSPSKISNDRIPLFNPVKELDKCGDVVYAIRDVAISGRYVKGSKTDKFEERFAKAFRSPSAIAVSSGTSALELMLRAEEIGRGDKVVTSAHTFVAVLESILNVGAEPLLVDIDEQHWQIPEGNWAEDIVLVSHLYGGVSPAVKSKARLLYEDASQSLGATLEGQYLGTIARAGAISLYPTKNLSALGDAGVILTRDEELAVRLRALRDHGQIKAQVHEYCGTTARMDEIQAVILRKKLKIFSSFLTDRRNAAKYYDEHLSDLPLKFPVAIQDSKTAPNLYVIRCEQRDQLKQFLDNRGIDSGIHYPTPFHLMPAYKDRTWAKISLPNTERLCKEILSLPLWVGILEEQQAKVVSAIRDFFKA